MRAIVIQRNGGPEVLAIEEVPEPQPRPGHVVIQVKAFGVNHAETHMRKGEWPEAMKISGIECVGVVRSDPYGRFPVGQKVVAMMGGMGRTIIAIRSPAWPSTRRVPIFDPDVLSPTVRHNSRWRL